MEETILCIDEVLMLSFLTDGLAELRKDKLLTPMAVDIMQNVFTTLSEVSDAGRLC